MYTKHPRLFRVLRFLQVPDKPTNLIARPSSNSIRVSWSPPKDPNIMVRGYSIGWGKGFPYTFSETLDGKQRSFNIENLGRFFGIKKASEFMSHVDYSRATFLISELNSEYVIAVRPYNSLGDGLPAYVSVRTREEPPPEDQITILPPVGLKAVVLSSSSAILHWTDPTRGQVRVCNFSVHVSTRSCEKLCLTIESL